MEWNGRKEIRKRKSCVLPKFVVATFLVDVDHGVCSMFNVVVIGVWYSFFQNK
jgi:hypothetical protein